MVVVVLMSLILGLGVLYFELQNWLSKEFELDGTSFCL